MSAKEDSLKNVAWEELKKQGSEHYQNEGVQPIDLYREIGILRHWIIGEICQHALRNRNQDEPVNPKDCDKIAHYSQLLKEM